MTQVVIPVKIPKWLWEEFKGCAKRRRRKPEFLVQQVAFDYVQRVTDAQLLADSRRDAQRAKFRIQDTEELIRQLRRRRLEKATDGRAKKASAGGA